MNSVERSLAQIVRSPEFSELTDGPLWKIDLRYASTNNFVGENMYGSFNRAFLHSIAAIKLLTAVKALQLQHVNHRFLIFDALRPRSVQRVLWENVVGTKNQMYIANPDKGSLHNYGLAVDLSILDSNGRALDMGADYDDFREIAQPQLESEFYSQGLLTDLHIANRQLLRSCMHAAGFQQLPHEWWHFDALTRAEAQAQFTLVE